ncbi:hypothetical protein E2C01_069461 [Portunus trituberculatus]|uniref:Ig-like domain-containing protein n=1 Tax=Portunus trituberculatus TaxID=210409 RepID=A0A5B7I0U8_PORTR|nr:hypothetical protein [Portunus trituberculatus]
MNTFYLSPAESPGEPQVEVEGNGKVMSGDEVALVCSSTGGNPAPELT